jgi:hypothetical protein
MIRTRKLCSVMAVPLLPLMLAHGVCLNGHPSVNREFKGSKAVVLATVIGQREVLSNDGFFFDGTIYRLKIDRMLRGGVSKHPEVFSENSSGRFPMVVGSKYLLFIYQERDRLLVDNCGNSGLASERRSELKAVERLSSGER